MKLPKVESACFCGCYYYTDSCFRQDCLTKKNEYWRDKAKAAGIPDLEELVNRLNKIPEVVGKVKDAAS